MSNRREQLLESWNRLTPQQRDYDRYVGKIPVGASWECETEEGQKVLEERRKERGLSCYEQGCSCHIDPPCSYCTRRADGDEGEALINTGQQHQA